MRTAAKSPYDTIARYYRYLFEDWDAAVAAEGERLAAILAPRGVRMVLDATCGTGIQCLGLAMQGLDVTGCDSSAAMLREARRNARLCGARVRYVAADIRSLGEGISGEFDAAISLGNSLSHLPRLPDLDSAFRSLFSLLRPGGTCLVDAWDYDRMFRERPSGIYNRAVEVGGRRIVMYDTRSYGDGVVTSTFNLLRETGRGWKAAQTVMELKAWRKDELVESLRKAGFSSIEDLTEGQTVQIVANRPQRWLKRVLTG